MENEEVRLYCKQLGALAFLQPDAVEGAFEDLEEYVGDRHPDLVPLYQYFEDTYIGRPNRLRRRAPALFPIEFWNVRTQTVEGIPRTTNKIEGWHRALQSQFESHHPSVWRFLLGIRREHKLQYLSLQQILAGQDPPTLRKKYRDTNNRVNNLIARHTAGEMTTPETLRALAHNIAMNT